MPRTASTSKRRSAKKKVGNRRPSKKRSTGRRRSRKSKAPKVTTATCQKAREDQTIMIEQLIKRVNDLTARLREAEG